MSFELGFIILILIYGMMLLEKWLNRKLPHYEDVSETKGTNLLYWGGILILLALLALAYFGDLSNMTFVKWATIAGITVMWTLKAALEWKYLESKKYVNTLIVMGLGVVLVFGGFFVYEGRTQTTYGELLSSVIGDKEIEEIYILSWDVDEERYRHKKVAITDKDMINRFFEDSIVNMELQKRNVLPGMEYRMMIKTSGRQIIHVEFSPGENLVRIQHENYVIDGENEILEVLNSMELEWEKY
ncbi:DUF4181 domain-containing protein [Bacillus alkalisoli]|uniref:DUF4181 domain-containing protein n=1 Tax=Bacillus alkalisoli TaxID=2011008 RepID=UPI000C232F39|nr:DUF4181 domain-containing protein [Bacillus alkalisoli]